MTTTQAGSISSRSAARKRKMAKATNPRMKRVRLSVEECQIRFMMLGDFR
jgi:hypothetical protein